MVGGTPTTARSMLAGCGLLIMCHGKNRLELAFPNKVPEVPEMPDVPGDSPWGHPAVPEVGEDGVTIKLVTEGDALDIILHVLTEFPILVPNFQTMTNGMGMGDPI